MVSRFVLDDWAATHCNISTFTFIVEMNKWGGIPSSLLFRFQMRCSIQWYINRTSYDNNIQYRT